jgi:predicted metal-dependent peptidase
MNHEEKMSSARAATLFKAPYAGSVVYGFVFTPMPGIGTMLCTRSMVLGYDPEWAEMATVEELAADIFHEYNHFMRGHFLRAVGIDDPALFNLAGDFAINPDMKAAGWKLAEGERGAVYPEDYKLPPGKTTEEYYELLKQQKNKGGSQSPQPQPSPGQPQGQGQGGQGQQQQQQPAAGQAPGQQGQQPSSGPTPGQPPPGQGQGQQPSSDGQGGPGSGEKPAPGIGRGHCGGIGGHSHHTELEEQLNKTPDLGRPEAEISGITKRAANDLRAHIEKHGRGSVPGALVQALEVFDDEPHVRWQDELAQVIRDMTGRLQSGGFDFSLRRPSKRSLLRGIIRPGMVEYLPEIAVIRDSSGSMGQPQLTTAACESYQIMRALGIDEVWFTDADTTVARPWMRVGPQFFKDLKEAHGRGGTDFRPGIQSALRLSPRPDIIIYITDGDGTTTNMPPPDVSVIWCIVPSYYNKAPANWGHVVIISEDPKVRKKGVTRPGDPGDDDDDL